MAVTLTLYSPSVGIPVDNTQQETFVDFTAALTGNYGTGSSHGDTISFAGFDYLKSNSVPIKVEIWESPAAGTVPTGYLFYYCYGTTLANGLLSVLSAEGTEYTEGSAYSAALLAAALRVRAWFPNDV